jgi:hypothetical protein
MTVCAWGYWEGGAAGRQHCKHHVAPYHTALVTYWLLLGAGGRSRVPTAHSILLCAVLGPLGLLCHLVTKVSPWPGRAGGRLARG